MKKTVELSVNAILNLGMLINEFDSWGSTGRPAVEPLAEPLVQALVDNLIAIQPTIQAYQMLDEKSQPYAAFKKELLELERAHAMTDAQGKPRSVNGRYIPNNLAEYELAVYELKQKHAAAVTSRQAKLDEMITVELTTVERQYLPKAGISISALAKLSVFVVPDTTPPVSADRAQAAEA